MSFVRAHVSLALLAAEGIRRIKTIPVHGEISAEKEPFDAGAA
jgi:hypothetical protein